MAFDESDRHHGLSALSHQVNENFKLNKLISFGGGAILNSSGEVMRIDYYCPHGSKLLNFFHKHREELEDIIKQETKHAKKPSDTSVVRNRPVVKSLLAESRAESRIPQPVKPVLFLPRKDLREWFPRFLSAVYHVSGSKVMLPSVFPCPLLEWDQDVDKIMTKDEFLLLGPEARLAWKLPRALEGVTHYYQTNTFLWKLRLVAALILRRYGININTFAQEVTAEDRQYNLLSEEQIIGLQDQEDIELVEFLSGARAVLSFAVGDFVVETRLTSWIDAPVFEVGEGYILREFHVEYAKGNYVGYYCTSHISQMTGASEGTFSKIKIVKKTAVEGKIKHVTRFLAVEHQKATQPEREVRKVGVEEVVVLDSGGKVKEENIEDGDEDPDDPLGEEPVSKKSRLIV